MSKTFDDWLHREDYGDREQLRRCWDAAEQAAYEQSAQLADRRDSSCDPRTEAEQTAHDIAKDIRALAAGEAGKEKDKRGNT